MSVQTRTCTLWNLVYPVIVAAASFTSFRKNNIRRNHESDGYILNFVGGLGQIAQFYLFSFSVQQKGIPVI